MIQRAAIGLCLLVLCLGAQPRVASHIAQKNSAESVSAPSPPGRLIDLGGYRLHLNCTGTKQGLPTVVLSAGAGDFSTDCLWCSQKFRNSLACVRTTEAVRLGVTWVRSPGP